MKVQWWLPVGLLALLLAGAAVAGYRWAPEVVSAAQHEEVSPQVTPAATPESRRQEVRKGDAWLGVIVSNGTNGTKVEQVLPNSPAAKAGVQEGDLITSVNGETVGNAKQLADRIRGLRPNDNVALAVQRNGASQTIQVTLGQALVSKSTAPFRAPGPDALGPLGALGSLLPDLRDIPADQRFDHFLGGSFNLTDKDGKPVTVNIVPGVVTAVASDTVKLRPNGKDGDDSFGIGQATRVAPGKRQQLTEWLKPEDKVIVIVRQGASQADDVYDLTAIQQRLGQPFAQPKSRPNASPSDSPLSLNPRQFGNGLRQGLDQLRKGLDSLEKRLDQPSPPRTGM